MLDEELGPLGCGGHPLPVVVTITVVLNYFTSGSFQGLSGEICGISQSAAHHSIKQVMDAMYQSSGQYIRHPTNQVCQAGRVIGFGPLLDSLRLRGQSTMRVAIKVPSEQPGTLMNRKGFHSLNLEIVCDHCKRILQIGASFPGSCHNSYILRQSQVPQLFRPSKRLYRYILGEKGRLLKTWLLTPVLNPNTKPEDTNNSCHMTTWATIEQAIGLLKVRFRCLDRSGEALQNSPSRLSCIVVVCCVLYNLVHQRGVAWRMTTTLNPLLPLRRMKWRFFETRQLMEIHPEI
ncbi:putative nuclease HARBI1 [Heterodontus francisci]|uniref:putative nuclease HARBI1 n=1 Tax=Heterodontus francisci TaxID=7792 RepID=UPI00355C0F7C